MKQLTSYNRVAGYLNKVFDILNEEFFESELSRPTITIQSTPKAYGHFSLREDTWVSKLGGTHEINIGAGTLSRPIEEVVATLLHEMVHYYNHVNGIQDCSRGNTYHNRRFKEAAEARGLAHHNCRKLQYMRCNKHSCTCKKSKRALEALPHKKQIEHYNRSKKETQIKHFLRYDAIGYHSQRSHQQRITRRKIICRLAKYIGVPLTIGKRGCIGKIVTVVAVKVGLWIKDKHKHRNGNHKQCGYP